MVSWKGGLCTWFLSRDRMGQPIAIDRQDRNNWHLNLTFQVTCNRQLSQFLRCFVLWRLEMLSKVEICGNFSSKRNVYGTYKSNILWCKYCHLPLSYTIPWLPRRWWINTSALGMGNPSYRILFGENKVFAYFRLYSNEFFFIIGPIHPISAMAKWPKWFIVNHVT